MSGRTFSQTDPSTGNSPVNILLVDDDIRNLDVLESVLEAPAYHLLRVQTAQEALLALIEGEFAVIVLDIQMPGTNGIELAHLIKQRKRTRDIPIIFLTAYYQEDKDVLQGYEVGAVDYLTKPVNPRILKSKIAIFAELFRKSRELAVLNGKMEGEIARRQMAEEALRQVNTDLEVRVQQRTAELSRAYDNLRTSEQALRASERRLTTTLSRMPASVYTCDAQGRVTFYNEAAVELWGQEPQIGKDLWCGSYRIFRPDGTALPLDQCPMAITLSEGRAVRGEEIVIERPDGTRRNVLPYPEPILDESGAVVGTINMLLDISDRKRLEEAQEIASRLPRENPAPVIRLSRKGLLRYANPAAEAILASWKVVVGGEVPTHISEITDSVLSTGERRAIELKLDELTYEVMVVPVSQSSYVNLYFNDTTERNHAERAAQRLAAIVESSEDAILSRDMNGLVASWNKAAERLFGYTADEVIGMPLTILIPPDRCRDESDRIERVHLGTRTENYETLRRRKDGSLVNISLTVSPIKDSSGVVVGVSMIARDISERRQAEAAVRESEARFRTMADNIAQFAWMADKQGLPFWYNQRWFDYTGTTLQEMEACGWRNVHHPDYAERVTDKFQACVEAGHIWEDTFPLRGADGTYRWFLSRAVPIRNEAGQIHRWFGTNTDITEQKRFEQDLERARDLAVQASRAKDEFLAALSHELRTPLNPVLLLASEAANDSTLPMSVRLDFETIAKNVSLEARLIDDLLDLTRITRGKLALDLRIIEAREVLNDAVATVRTEIERKQISLVVDLEGADQSINCDRARLTQVFWNILKNAVKFTPEKGTITLGARRLFEEDKLVVSVSDTGIGMTPDEIHRVFDAFSQGEHASDGISHRFGGLGLGLAISRRLVELHSGSICASSDGRNRGTTFSIGLPLAHASKTSRTRPPSDAPVPSIPKSSKKQAQHTRILLVEDHEPTRATLAQLLTRRHYLVETAGSLAEARLLASQKDFHLLISDIGLPDGEGYDLMMELGKQQHLKGIALTGYGMEQDIARSQAAGFIAHLTKPVRVQALETALAAAVQ